MALKKYRRQVIRVRDANDELPEVILSTGDEAGRIIQLVITGGENYGTHCRFWLQKEEGLNVYQDMEQVTASYPTWEAAINTGGIEPGVYPCMFRIGDNDGSVTETFKTTARVLQGMLIDAEESEEMQSQLSEFEQRTEDAIAANETATAAANDAAEAATEATEAIEHALDEVDVRVLTSGLLSVTNVDGVPTSYDVKQQVSDAINPKIEDADAATQAANDAATAANSAATSATDAAAAATSATSAATQATTAANSAASSATSAASDASAAATSATSAATNATSAATAATNAAVAANTIVDSLDDAIYLKYDLTTSDIIQGKYVRGDTGGVSSSDSWYCTDFISLGDAVIGTALKTIVSLYAYVGCAFYDSNKTFISGACGTSEGISGNVTKYLYLQIPENAVYFRTTLAANKYSTPSDFVIRCLNLGVVAESPEEIANLGINIASVSNSLDKSKIDIGAFSGYDYDLHFEQGGYYADGSRFSSTKDIRCGLIYAPKGKYSVAVNGYKAYVIFCHADESITSRIWAKTTDFTFEVTDKDIYMKLDCNLASGDDVTPVDNAITLKCLGIYDEFVDARGEYSTLGDRLDAIENIGGIPDYYYENDYLDSKVEDYIDNLSDMNNGISFAFITDLHLKDNTGSSKTLMKYILNNTPCPFVISGGDIPCAYSKTNGNEKEEIIEYINDWNKWIELWESDRVFQLRGNHDYVVLSQTDHSNYFNLPTKAVWQVVCGKTDMEVHGDPNGCFYYFDIPSQKIRFIVMDGHAYNSSYPASVVVWLGAYQKKWFGKLLQDSDGYNIIVLTHEAYNPNLSSYEANLADIGTALGAYKTRGTFSVNDGSQTYIYDYSQSTGTICFCLSGHSHKDEYNIDTNGVLCISTTCDATYNNDPNVTRTRGTISESAFDIFTVDTTNKTVKTVRIGGGQNRSFSYA